MITTYTGWVSDGRPYQDCQPVSDLRKTLSRYGFTVYSYPDDGHLRAATPEDHCPFSHTPWPGAQPYPHGMACDIMPGGQVDWIALGAQIEADRRAGIPGTEWIKYLNWTDTAGKCWHSSWQPGYRKTASTDVGHIHASCRTDYVTSAVAATYDPVARLRAKTAGGIQMEQADRLVFPTNSLGRAVGQAISDGANLRDWWVGSGQVVPGDPSWPRPDSPLGKLMAFLNNPPAPAVVLSPEDRAAMVADVAAQVTAGLTSTIQAAVTAAVADLRARMAAGAQAEHDALSG